MSKAKEQADAAISLSPELPEAHYALGLVFEKRLRYDEAEASTAGRLYFVPTTVHHEMRWEIFLNLRADTRKLCHCSGNQSN